MLDIYRQVKFKLLNLNKTQQNAKSPQVFDYHFLRHIVSFYSSEHILTSFYRQLC